MSDMQIIYTQLFYENNIKKIKFVTLFPGPQRQDHNWEGGGGTLEILCTTKHTYKYDNASVTYKINWGGRATRPTVCGPSSSG